MVLDPLVGSASLSRPSHLLPLQSIRLHLLQNLLWNKEGITGGTEEIPLPNGRPALSQAPAPLAASSPAPASLASGRPRSLPMPWCSPAQVTMQIANMDA